MTAITPPYHGRRHYKTTRPCHLLLCSQDTFLYPTRLTYPAATQKTSFSSEEKPLFRFCFCCPLVTATTRCRGQQTHKKGICVQLWYNSKKWAVSHHKHIITRDKHVSPLMKYDCSTYLIKTLFFFKYICMYLVPYPRNKRHVGCALCI